MQDFSLVLCHWWACWWGSTWVVVVVTIQCRLFLQLCPPVEISNKVVFLLMSAEVCSTGLRGKTMYLRTELTAGHLCPSEALFPRVQAAWKTFKITIIAFFFLLLFIDKDHVHYLTFFPIWNANLQNKNKTTCHNVWRLLFNYGTIKYIHTSYSEHNRF